MAAVAAFLLPFHVIAPVDAAEAAPPVVNPAPMTASDPAPLFSQVRGAAGLRLTADTTAIVKVVTLRGNPLWQPRPWLVPTTLDLPAERGVVAGMRFRF